MPWLQGNVGSGTRRTEPAPNVRLGFAHRGLHAVGLARPARGSHNSGWPKLHDAAHVLAGFGEPGSEQAVAGPDPTENGRD